MNRDLLFEELDNLLSDLDDNRPDYHPKGELRKSLRDTYVKGNIHREHGGTVARLRLDWELNEEADLANDAHAVKAMMISALAKDLEDLIINGDVEHHTDPLLKSIDGEKKRGKESTDIKIFSGTMYREHVPRKKSVEYTVYLLMWVNFE